MPEEKFDELFGGADNPQNERVNADDWGNCNYCVNHWGIDLCGCGSGEKVGECDNDFQECLNNIPMQSLEENYSSIAGGWLTGF